MWCDCEQRAGGGFWRRGGVVEGGCVCGLSGFGVRRRVE